MFDSANFLNALASQCFDAYGDRCERLTIIFPNKRAGLYFANYLSKKYDAPIWSPKINSLEEYVFHKQDKKWADDLQLSFILYNTYKELVIRAESFDVFFPWGEMILKDFNDIDSYLVDPSHIFQVVKSQKELDESFRFLSVHDQKVIQQFWQGFLPKPSKKQSEFIRTWEILAPLYETFNLRLEEIGLTYKGKMFKEYAEKKEVIDHVWFAGFNAFTAAEEKIIKTYLGNPNNAIFWDIDQYYLSDEKQEAGVFFRQYANDNMLGGSIKRDAINKLNKASKSVKVIGAPFGVGQVMSASQALIDLLDSGIRPEDILVVLADETLLPSLVEYLPPTEHHVNITMGWSLANAQLFMMFEQTLKLSLEMSIKDHIHIDFIRETFQYANLLGLSDEQIKNFNEKAINENLVYHPKENVELLFDSLQGVFRSIDSVSGLTDSLMEFIKKMNEDELNEVNKSAREAIYKTLKQTKQVLDESQVNLELSSFLKLFTKIGTGTKLTLTGDPMQGVQVMGVLETRNLSFEHIIVIGMNEGAWPSDTSNNSFIPYNIRKAFELPVVEHNDAMQSYLFYRLLHDAKHVEFYYNNIAEFNHNGELSRYIQQLLLESKINITTGQAVNTIKAQRAKEITIKKDQRVLDKLKMYDAKSGKKRLSPSALNSYIECPLRFYFRYVENLYESEEIKEDIDAALLGNLLHHTMEYLYEDKTHVSTEDLDNINDQIEKALGRSFKVNKLSIENETMVLGRQQVAYEVVKKYVYQIVEYDRKNAPFEILGLEKKGYFVDFEIETLDDTIKVGLRGIIDRIDRHKDIIRILDYKSGNDSREFAGVPSLFDAVHEKRNKAVFQLLYYCMLYDENHPNNQLPIQPGLFNSSDLFKKDFTTVITENISGRKPAKQVVFDVKELLEEYKIELQHLLTELYNPMMDFVQAEDQKKCTYCPYAGICFRS